ncbi:PmoA family protein [Streptomyces sp. bgisy029]|uniref:DUF6807 domain-containing protein n=1 Tax=Streptomyces sp. bgisy029 TaxID=3413771 RepID=UPI003D7095B2
MSGGPELRFVHHVDERVVLRYGGLDLLSLVYRPEAAREAPKPYLHPLRTLAGRVVTGYRPNDHRWHKGLQLTASHLSGQNLWGGRCYVRGQGYQEHPERLGSMSHEGFEEMSTSATDAVLAERLVWRNHEGDAWAEERRRIAVHDIDPEAGYWVLTWSSSVANLRAEPLRFGSPTTEGRELAGYTGLFWRGPRDFRGGRVIGPHGGGEQLMGTQAPWLACGGEFDEVDGHGTVVIAHAPENDHGGEHGEHPAHWFVRSDPFAAMAPSWAFFDELVLPPGEALVRRWRVVIADGAWSRDRIAGCLSGIPW